MGAKGTTDYIDYADFGGAGFRLAWECQPMDRSTRESVTWRSTCVIYKAFWNAVRQILPG